MNPSSRFTVYGILGFASALLLTYANFERMRAHNEFFKRSMASLERSTVLKNQIEVLPNIEQGNPFFRDADLDVERELVESASSAGMPGMRVGPVVDSPIGNSGYCLKIVPIEFGKDIGLKRLLEFVRNNTTQSETSTSNQMYILSRLHLSDPDGKPAIVGQNETWRCEELTLSYVTKIDKSP